MKFLIRISLLVCLSHSLLADDQATPSPTPIYVAPLGRRAIVRRAERQRVREAQLESNATVRAQAKATRRQTAAQKAQARAAASARERAQHQVDAEARRESAKETPRPTSDLMKRMGFSEQEIAAQKAQEELAKPQASPSGSSAKTAGDKPASVSPSPKN